MKIKLLLSLLVVSSCVSFAQISITGFGTGQFADGGSSGFSQDADSSIFSGSDQTGQFFGTFSPVDISSQSAGLLLTATKTSVNTSSFQLELFDGSLFQPYSGFWSNFTQGVETTSFLSIGSATPGFNFSQVQGLQFVFSGSGDSLTLDFNNLQAIPEPSAFAAFLGLGVLGFAASRRRRA